MARPGITLDEIGCHITHAPGGGIKTPFPHLMPELQMFELSPGSPAGQGISFSGQLGVIHFAPTIRLPRHIHISSGARRELVAERILVLNGVGLVELCGEIYVIPPETLVEIGPGVPHTWTACPAGLEIGGPTLGGGGQVSGAESRGTEESKGSFLMVYEYETVTGFFPVKGTTVVKSVEEYDQERKFEAKTEEDVDPIRFPALTAEEVLERSWVAWGSELRRGKEILRVVK